MAESVEKDLDTPGGSIPEYQRWQSRSVQGSDRERAYIDLDGKSHPLQEGERFSVKLDRAANRYDAVVTKADGTETVVGSGPMNSNTSHSQEQTLQPLNIDKDRLNEIIGAASSGKPDSEIVFGKQIPALTESDKADLKTISEEIAGHIASQMANDPQWKEFEKITDELEAKGSILSFQFPPTWLVNGGPSQQTIEVEGGAGAKVKVPERIFNTFYWKARAEHLVDPAGNHPGHSARSLGKELADAAHFLREIGKL